MAVTIKDVAREAGVSFSTVSKVVNHSHEISDATAIRVREVIERLGYTPNVRAVSFKRHSTRNIAFLMKLEKGVAFTYSHIFEILSGAHGALARKGYSITLVDMSGEEKPGDTVKAVMAAGGHDGLIVHAKDINDDAAAMLARGIFPHVVIGKPDFESQVCWLDTNNVLGGVIAVRHLADGGARHIAYIGVDRKHSLHSLSNDRLAGVRSALRDLGVIMQENDIRYTDSSSEESYVGALELLTQKDRPDGIICACNLIAIGVLSAAREIGLTMPVDLQLISFDDYPFSRIMDPSPTVVDIDTYDLGGQVASQLLKNIRKPALHVQSYITLPELIIRGTTRKAD